MTLKTTMAGLLSASSAFGKPQSIPLQRGLVVSVNVKLHHTFLCLLRRNSRASLTELWTVIAALPYQLRADQVVYEYDADGGLRAQWATPKENAQ